jgi:hypothetical protein
MKAFLFTLIIFFSGILAGQSQSNSKISGVEVYYFHATNRCITCETVENVTREALKEYYGNQISLKTINRDQEKDHPMMIKHKVSGQTLLVLKGDKAVDLTTFAFMNARTKPEKLKAKIKETIDKM